MMMMMMGGFVERVINLRNPHMRDGCIAHARSGHISTSALKSDVIIVFLDRDFFEDPSPYDL